MLYLLIIFDMIGSTPKVHDIQLMPKVQCVEMAALTNKSPKITKAFCLKVEGK